MAREQYSYQGDKREGGEKPTVEAKVDTRASKGHPDRNEDAALGDIIRLKEEAVKPPEIKTFDTAADTEIVRQARERELKVADKLKDKQVFGVLDGISGGKEGEGTGVVASRLASARLSERMAEMPPGLTVDQTKDYVLKAMQAADADVKAYRDNADAITNDPKRKKELKQMGTTADMVALVDNPDGSKEAVIGHVGDSRVYLFDEKTKKLKALTVDENVVGYLHRVGQITREQYDLVMNTSDISQLPPDLQKLGANFGMDTRGAKNTLFNALGSGGVKEENVFSVRVEPGQKLLLTSDGVHDNLNDAEIEQLLAAGKTMEQITEAAYGTGRKPDDISGTLIEIKGENPEARAARQAEEAKDVQMRTWEKEVGDAHAEIARLEALKAASSAGNAPVDRNARANVMMNMDARAIMEVAKMGGPKELDKRIRDWKMFSLSREYQVAQSDVADTQKEMGLSASQAKEQLAIQQQVIDWQRQVYDAARSSTPAMRGKVMGTSIKAVEWVSARMKSGESPEQIMQQARATESDARKKAESLSALDSMTNRLQEIAGEWQRLEGEKRDELAAQEQQQMHAARQQLESAAPARGREAAPQQRPEAQQQQQMQQPAKKKPWYKRLFGG
ncbi:MAG TPA: protein phosphatase 2C domain-containing protein [Candidatus Eisenbacteria bacterium]|jgi:serine/threonine protein phosphatase PrpC|nr:protein phosphatase 2C domain-containing protein [Candidatus Eisenbacteria bacterium]